ncbi:restriction endonuclease subunit S [Streptococcus oralis]|uniref:restriction endonuclease subunit S n=1 Tax=Streptococcus oralis TaxID=1303 RepID=UPI00069F71A4|nr:restriction endonuclease subunit S [Streptococcus oralis]
MKKVKLGEICEIVTGSTPKSSNPNYWNGEYKWITPAEISDDDFIVFDTQRKITKLGIEKTGLKSFPKGTVLLSSRAPIGKVAISGCEMYCNQGFKNFICSNKINNEYLYYFLKSRKNYLNILGRGATFKEISKSIAYDIEIFLPTYDIQRKQVKVLKKIDKLIYTRKEQLIEFEHLVKSRFNEMFGDDSNFDIDRLNNSIKEMFIGPFGSSLKNEYFVQKEKSYCMVYEQKHAIKKTMNLETRYVDEKKYKELKRFSIYGGDIIVSCRGTIGEIFQVPNDAPLGIMHPSIMKIRLDNSKYIPVFFTFMLSEYMKVQKNNSQGSGVKMAITASELGKIEFPLPPLSLQNEFADFVAQVDKSQFACGIVIKLWRNSLKSSII